jgi:hypothetical protein
MSQENVDVIRQGWDAWLRGDLPGLFRQVDPEIVWDTSHFHDWPESTYHGLQGVERFLTEWVDVWADYEVDVDRNGKVTRLDNYENRAEALEAAGLRE